MRCRPGGSGAGFGLESEAAGSRSLGFSTQDFGCLRLRQVCCKEGSSGTRSPTLRVILEVIDFSGFWLGVGGLQIQASKAEGQELDMLSAGHLPVEAGINSNIIPRFVIVMTDKCQCPLYYPFRWTSLQAICV